MKKENNLLIKNVIEEYQCPGCVCGSDIKCYAKGENLECSKHVAGTMGFGVGSFFLGMPRGFCRIGFIKKKKMKLLIFEKPQWGYDMFNIPVWKHLDKKGNTIIRGVSPRVNWPFLHIFIGDHLKEFNCLEISQANIDEMD